MKKGFAKFAAVILGVACTLNIPTVSAKTTELVNVAYGKPATATSLSNYGESYYPKSAVDETMDTLFITNSGNDYLTIDLEQCYNIRQIKLSTRKDTMSETCSLSNFDIYGSASGDFDTDGVLLYSFDDTRLEYNTSYTRNVLDGVAETNNVRYIKVCRNGGYGPGGGAVGAYWYLSDLAVYANVEMNLDNVAYKKPATATSLSSYGANYYPLNAVDESMSTLFITNSGSDYITIDLLGNYNIEKVKFSTRKDTVGDTCALSNFDILGSASGNFDTDSVLLCSFGDKKLSYNTSYLRDVAQKNSVRYVRVARNGGYLNGGLSGAYWYFSDISLYADKSAGEQLYTNVAYKKPATTTSLSGYGENYYPKSAVDESMDTLFITNTGKDTITIDLEDYYSVKKLMFSTRKDTMSETSSISNFDIMGSASGDFDADGVMLYSFGDEKLLYNRSYNIDVTDDSNVVRYVRVSRNGQYGATGGAWGAYWYFADLSVYAENGVSYVKNGDSFTKVTAPVEMKNVVYTDTQNEISQHTGAENIAVSGACQNKTDTDKTVYVIMAAYSDDGALTGIKISEKVDLPKKEGAAVSVPVGLSSSRTELALGTDGYIKTFFVDSLQSIMPWTNGIVLNK